MGLKDSIRQYIKDSQKIIDEFGAAMSRYDTQLLDGSITPEQWALADEVEFATRNARLKLLANFYR